MNQPADTLTEADILDQIVQPGRGNMPPEFARTILALHFSEDAIRRMNELAEKNREATLTAAERMDLERYLRVGSFLNLLQAKAHCSLASTSAEP